MMASAIFTTSPDLVLYAPSARGTQDRNSSAEALPLVCKMALDNVIPAAVSGQSKGVATVGS